MVNIGSFGPRLLPSVDIGSGTVGPERVPQLPSPPAQTAAPAQQPPAARPTPEQSEGARARHSASANVHPRSLGRVEQQRRHIDQELNAGRPQTLSHEIRETLANPSFTPSPAHSRELSGFQDRLERRENLSSSDRGRLAYLMSTYAPPGTR